jgi:vacuolar-type H+-ATPase subunit E/Vma4
MSKVGRDEEVVAGAAPDGKTQLLSGITRDAGAEAAEIVRGAEQAVAERVKAAAAQAAAIRDEATKRGEETARGIARQGEQAAAVECRRLSLKVREEVSRRILTGATQKLEELVGNAEYRAVLRGWIVEAALGLGASEAEVRASAREMAQIDEGLLAEAAREVAAITGNQVRLRRSEERQTAAQGIVVTSSDGRTAFNNQVVTRMERYQSDIRKLIYEALKES